MPADLIASLSHNAHGFRAMTSRSIALYSTVNRVSHPGYVVFIIYAVTFVEPVRLLETCHTAGALNYVMLTFPSISRVPVEHKNAKATLKHLKHSWSSLLSADAFTQYSSFSAKSSRHFELRSSLHVST